MDIEKVRQIAEQTLEGSDMFVVDCTINPANEISLVIDSDSHVTIDACAALNRAIDAAFDRDEEDYSLTVASAGIGEPLRSVRQLRKVVGSPVGVLLLNGIKVLAMLEEVTDEGITIAYDEKVAVEGRKRKELQRVTRTYRFDEIKSTCEHLDYK